ncbi:MAG: helix-turn-helix domain-containing protein [Butyricicoccaceae bacterium]
MLVKPSYDKIKNSFWRQPKLISVEMEDHLHTKMLRAMHVHDDRVEILLIRNGEGIHTIDGNAYTTCAGDVLIYNAGVVHDECADRVNGMDIICCSASDIELEGQRPNTLIPDGCSPVIHHAKNYQELESLLIMILSSRDEEIKHYLLWAFLLMVREEAMQTTLPGEDKEIQLGHFIQQYLDAHYLQDIQLQEVAEQMNMSPYYLSRVFRKAIGCSPKQYIMRRRIGEAQSWLLMTDESVTDIAIRVGYNSVSNFHNTFHRIVGMSPQQYREYWKNK